MLNDDNLNWRKPPPVIAPAHNDKNRTVKYLVSNDISGAHRANGLKSPIYQAWVHLHKRKPPIPNASILDISEHTPDYCSLMEATACFCGVKRPYNDQENGSEVVVYVLKPDVTVIYAPRLSAPIETKSIAGKFVFTVSVVLSNSLESKDIAGIVSRIEMVKCDPANDGLPKDYESRYEKKLW